MSSAEKKKAGKKKSGKKRVKSPSKKIVFQPWIKSRRSKRTKGPWKGIFRDPVKLCLYIILE